MHSRIYMSYMLVKIKVNT